VRAPLHRLVLRLRRHAAKPRQEHDAVALHPMRHQFMITQDMKRRLRMRGYSDPDITNMRPAEAHDILAAQPDHSHDG
jgi:hypothetical protein